MASISITPVEETHTVTSISVSNIFIDIQNMSVTVEVKKLDSDGITVGTETLIASGSDYSSIYNGSALVDFVLTQLGFTSS